MHSEPTKKILLVVSGMSPQVVTETLFALVNRDTHPWIPDEICLLSTSEGCRRAREELLSTGRDMFGKFCREYIAPEQVIKFDQSCIHAFQSDDHIVDDIRDLKDSALVADVIAKTVWTLTQEDHTEIHASIAGGRKSMGFLLGYSISLYGRPQDRLSHVLVSEGFEDCRDFYFKPKIPVSIKDRAGNELNTDDCVIGLAEIPILHLRGKLPKKMLEQTGFIC